MGKGGSFSDALNQQMIKQGKAGTKKNRERRYEEESRVESQPSMAADTVMMEKDPPMPRRMRSNQTF